MRIGIDARGITDGFKGGVGEYTQHIIQSLSESQDLDLEFLATGIRHNSEIIGVKNTWLQYPNRALNFSLKTLGRPYLDRAFSQKPDKVWMPNWNITSVSPETELILTVHDLAIRVLPEVFSQKMRLWHKYIGIDKLLDRTNTIIAISESTKRDLIDIYGVKSEKIKVIYSGIDPLFRQEFSQPSIQQVKQKYNLPEKYILYLGTIEPRKNIQLLIQAFEQVAIRDKEVKLVIAGVNGWLYKQIHQAIDNSPFRDRILRIGFVAVEDKPIVYKLARVFVYPSLYEGFGFPPLEAMASGTPTIVANNSVFPEIVLNSAYKTSPYDKLELSEIIYSMLTDNSLYKHYAKQGLERSLDFNWDKTAQEMRDVFINRYEKD
ncbi:MAG: glycosyltransferase family 4 protein [Minisyncoccia bacterium]